MNNSPELASISNGASGSWTTSAITRPSGCAITAALPVCFALPAYCDHCAFAVGAARAIISTNKRCSIGGDYRDFHTPAMPVFADAVSSLEERDSASPLRFLSRNAKRDLAQPAHARRRVATESNEGASNETPHHPGSRSAV